jgi:hypothetical protein
MPPQSEAEHHTAARPVGVINPEWGIGMTPLISDILTAAPLRVRGLARVQLHADLTILARLALALNRAQVVACAA